MVGGRWLVVEGCGILIYVGWRGEVLKRWPLARMDLRISLPSLRVDRSLN
jgi:hypothetical protein